VSLLALRHNMLMSVLPMSFLPVLQRQIHQAPRVLQSPFAASSQAATLRFRLLDRQLLLLAVPTLFDLVGAALLNVGLLAVTASATQMLRQSLLLFAALMGVCLWGKRLNSYHLTGLAGCLVSV
jgi:drug/metabolite transporter (DMT)-like permease